MTVDLRGAAYAASRISATLKGRLPKSYNALLSVAQG
jgi:hypothetical protein